MSRLLYVIEVDHDIASAGALECLVISSTLIVTNSERSFPHRSNAIEC